MLLISAVLLTMSAANLAIGLRCAAPDLFYYASSLARENPYINTPDGGTTLDGAKRSRLLKDMKAQIADVCLENQVGYVVLKSMDAGENPQTGRLRKNKLYW